MTQHTEPRRGRFSRALTSRQVRAVWRGHDGQPEYPQDLAGPDAQPVIHALSTG